VSKGSEIVGHKTLRDGSHEPLTRAEADEIMSRCDEADKRRAEAMPTEQSAIDAMMDAYIRLKEFGWRDVIYCPKDGSPFDAIEFGSSGIHECHYSGDWPDGSWWIHEAGDLWPSHPSLFKARTPDGSRQ
jgi:hypothetical protein